jgi:outer membrane protein
MNKRTIIKFIAQITIFLLPAINNIYGQRGSGTNSGQSSDSLSLKEIIDRVIASHPSVKEAREAIRMADDRIGMARTGYYPETSVTGSFTNIGPVTKLTIPTFGTFQLYPEYNYSAAINYNQLIYDFGRTRQNIALENEGKSISEQSLEQVKQKLALYAVNNYYTLVFLQAAIKIKDEQIATLNEHLVYIEKMMKSGSATEYQILTTKVKISAIESQKVDMLASLKAQQASLNSLIGSDQSNRPVVKTELSAELPLISSDSLLSFAYHNRDEVIVNEKKTELAELRYDVAKLHNKPVISFVASGGAKNGYIPDLYQFKPNYVVGLGIRIPILDGIRNRYSVSQAQSAINSMSYESDITKRNISNELYEAEAYMTAAEKKINQSELQLEQAVKAYSLAETSYKSGTITNLDLLDSNTAVSESRLMLLKSRIDHAASIYRLKAALGERLYNTQSVSR